MRTAHNQVQLLFTALAGSSLREAVSGRVYLYKQPVTPELESVVINALPVNNDQFQLGTANVNLYVPDMPVQVGDTKLLMPDAIRLDALTQLALVPLEELYTNEYRFEIANISGPIAVPEINQHYINLRIDFLFFPS